jgi:hypothetical protein
MKPAVDDKVKVPVRANSTGAKMSINPLDELTVKAPRLPAASSRLPAASDFRDDPVEETT